MEKPFIHDFNPSQMEVIQALRLDDYSLYKKARLKGNLFSSEISETKKRNRRAGNKRES